MAQESSGAPKNILHGSGAAVGPPYLCLSSTPPVAMAVTLGDLASRVKQLEEAGAEQFSVHEAALRTAYTDLSMKLEAIVRNAQTEFDAQKNQLQQLYAATELAMNQVGVRVGKLEASITPGSSDGMGKHGKLVNPKETSIEKAKGPQVTKYRWSFSVLSFLHFKNV